MPDGQMSDPAPPGPAWSVVKQQQIILPDANNRPVQGVNVTYQLADGTQATIFVPADRYSVDGVRAAVAEHAGTVYAVGQLTSETATAG